MHGPEHRLTAVASLSPVCSAVALPHTEPSASCEADRRCTGWIRWSTRLPGAQGVWVAVVAAAQELFLRRHCVHVCSMRHCFLTSGA